MAELTPLQIAQAAEAERINAGGTAALAAVSTLHPAEQIRALNNALARLQLIQRELDERAQYEALKAKFGTVA